MILHPIAPVYDGDSAVLILGSFPSVRSRKEGFFYGHPQNRFWKVLAAVFARSEPKTTAEKREMLLSCRIALWDVIASCDIIGSSDSSIRNVIPNDLSEILSHAGIRTVYLNGKTAEKYYRKYMVTAFQGKVFCLPSTSAANAAYSLEDLILEWRRIRESVETIH